MHRLARGSFVVLPSVLVAAPAFASSLLVAVPAFAASGPAEELTALLWLGSPLAIAVASLGAALVARVVRFSAGRRGKSASLARAASRRDARCGHPTLEPGRARA